MFDACSVFNLLAHDSYGHLSSFAIKISQTSVDADGAFWSKIAVMTTLVLAVANHTLTTIMKRFEGLEIAIYVKLS